MFFFLNHFFTVIFETYLIKRCFVFVLTVIAFLICSFAVDQTEADVSSILSHLSSKAITALKNVKIPVLNAQVGIIRSHIRSLLSFFRGREGDVSISFAIIN